MNDKIKEFWVESTFTVWPSPNKFTAGEYDWHLEKFAELIVQDIIDTVLIKARWHQEVDQDENTVGALCKLVDIIREEYGVE